MSRGSYVCVLATRRSQMRMIHASRYAYVARPQLVRCGTATFAPAAPAPRASMRIQFSVWIDCRRACWRWPHLATLPTRSGHQGMEGSRCERLGVSQFGCCHQPWRVTGSLGLKNPSGYWLYGVSCRTYNMQHSGGGGGVERSVVRGGGGYTP